MKVLHVIPSLSPSEGGPSAALPLLVQSLVAQAVKVDVATTEIKSPLPGNRALIANAIERNGGHYFCFPRQTQLYKYSWPFSKWLRQEAQHYDLLHIHALFSYTSVSAARISRAKGIPYIIRPLGVLNRWGRVNRRPMLKRLSLRWVELPILRHAAAIHYTSSLEKDEAALAHSEIARLRSVVIPLPVIASQTDEEQLGYAKDFSKHFPSAAGRSIVLFLSRLDPKKGIELLLRAFALARKKIPDLLLVLAGSGEDGYVASLRRLSEELAVDDAVLWPGFLAGDDKSAAFAAATIFVLPSFSENFGIAAAEALSHGVPTIISDQVGLADDIQRQNIAMVVPCDIERLAAAIEKLLLEPELRQRLSENGKRYAEEELSIETVGSALLNLYDSVLRPK